MKTPTAEQIIIVILIILLYLSFRSDEGYGYQSVDTYKVFDKKTGVYYDTEGKLDLVNSTYTKHTVKQN